MPFISMQIFSNQFLPWWILGHILIKKQELHNMHKKTNTLAMNVIEDGGETGLKKAHQWWQAFICVPPKNRESPMSACVGSGKCLTK